MRKMAFISGHSACRSSADWSLTETLPPRKQDRKGNNSIFFLHAEIPQTHLLDFNASAN
jgi:hypothetical protein